MKILNFFEIFEILKKKKIEISSKYFENFEL